MNAKLMMVVLPLVMLMVGCADPPTPTPVPAPTADPMFVSDGRGEPRSAAYWQEWSSCSGGPEAETARANGGREAGWVILDDLLSDPGILVGQAAPTTCALAVQILDASQSSNDAAYLLAAELLSAQLNLAVPVESCPAAATAVQSAQLLLLSIEFTGQGSYLGPSAAAEDRDLAMYLADQLATYNLGNLCR